jgi:hypothetical protein
MPLDPTIQYLQRGLVTFQQANISALDLLAKRLTLRDSDFYTRMESLFLPAGGTFNNNLVKLQAGQSSIVRLSQERILIATLSPATQNGVLVYRNISLVATGVNIKATQGKVYGWQIFNNAAAVRFVKFYNKATAPAVGTDVPVMTIQLAAASSSFVETAHGIDAFPLGIGIGATNLVADTDATAPSINDVLVNVFYF